MMFLCYQTFQQQKFLFQNFCLISKHVSMVSYGLFKNNEYK